MKEADSQKRFKEHFDRAASVYEDKYNINSKDLYIQEKEIRKRVIFEKASKYSVNKGCILEIGCATGKIIKYLFKKMNFSDALGIDYSAEMIKNAKISKDNSSKKLEFVNKNLEDLNTKRKESAYHRHKS